MHCLPTVTSLRDTASFLPPVTGPAEHPSRIPWFLCTVVNKINHFINNCVFLSPRESENTVGSEAWIFLSAASSGREIGTFPTFLRMSPKPNLENHPSHEGGAFRSWSCLCPQLPQVSLVLSFAAPSSPTQPRPPWVSPEVHFKSASSSLFPLVCFHSYYVLPVTKYSQKSEFL